VVILIVFFVGNHDNCFSCCYLFTNVAIFFYSANCFVKKFTKSLLYLYIIRE